MSAVGLEEVVEDMRVYLVSTPNCPGCLESKEFFQDEIDDGSITPVSIDDDKGWEIIKTLELMAVPAIVVERDGEYCHIDDEGSVKKCARP